MSMLFKENNFNPNHNIYSSAHRIEVPLRLEKSAAQALAVLRDGRYIIPAGTIYPSNDANAKGVIVNDYDVTDKDLIGAICVHGAILKAKLPKKVETAAENALKQIVFIDPTDVKTPKLICDPVMEVKVNAALDADLMLAIKNGEFRRGINGADALALLNVTSTGADAAKVVLSNCRVDENLIIVHVNIVAAAITAAQDISIDVAADLVNKDIALAAAVVMKIVA